ncbi:hypothetical protein [Streptomyces europaeiscabiei]|uniref:hypothetical protein n=1 Tax=Streptomyces europaeiscabiei TaxID=146819 RepID=UPI002E1424F4|nr:hypothetical protein OHB30_47755 [Streptomyces europaeiscabiei]
MLGQGRRQRAEHARGRSEVRRDTYTTYTTWISASKPIGGHEGNVTPDGRNWNGWMPGNETIGDVQFGYEITSSSGGLNFNTNNLTVSGG